MEVIHSTANSHENQAQIIYKHAYVIDPTRMDRGYIWDMRMKYLSPEQIVIKRKLAQEYGCAARMRNLKKNKKNNTTHPETDSD